MISIPQIGAIASAVKQSISLSDPYFSLVKLLVHANGTNGSTSITDSSSSALSITNSSCTISTTQYKFGGSSAYFNGTAGLNTAKLSQFNVFGVDATIEFFVYLNSVSSSPYLVELWSDTTHRMPIQISSDGKLHFYVVNGGVTSIDTTTVLSTSAFHHVAICFYGSSIYIFVDGVSAYSGSRPTIYNLSNAIRIGKYFDGSAGYLNGYIDELRITVGYARYTSAFTPPSSQFPDS